MRTIATLIIAAALYLSTTATCVAATYTHIADSASIVRISDGAEIDLARSVAYDMDKREWVVEVENLKGDVLECRYPAALYDVHAGNEIIHLHK